MRNISIILFIMVLLISCDKDIPQSEEQLILKDNKHGTYQVKQDFSMLDKADEIVGSTNDFNLFTSFEPDEEQKEIYEGDQEDFHYIKLNEKDKYIRGKVIIENKTNNPVKIENVFYQGDIKKDVLVDNKIYKKLYTITPANKSSELQVKIPFENNGYDEISFLPKYEGEDELNIVRFFVTKNNINYNNFDTNINEFEVTDKDFEEYDPFPIIEMLDKSNRIVSSSDGGGKKNYSKIKINKTLYETDIDLTILDEKGNRLFYKNDIHLEKKKSKILDIPKNVQNKINNKEESYLIYYSNRSEEILYDFISADKYRQPFPTTFQDVIKLN